MEKKQTEKAHQRYVVTWKENYRDGKAIRERERTVEVIKEGKNYIDAFGKVFVLPVGASVEKV